jgi:hypothetical protein
VIRLTLAAGGQIATAVVERGSGSAALDAAALVPGRVVTAGAPRTFMGTLTVRI